MVVESGWPKSEVCDQMSSIGDVLPQRKLLSNVDPALLHSWHPVARSTDVGENPHRVTLMGEAWVLYRHEGEIEAFVDQCPHRLAPLSLGRCRESGLECAYHGWRFDHSGQCIEIPALPPEARRPERARLSAAAGITERFGMVYLAPRTPLSPPPEHESVVNSRFQVGELPIIATRASAGFLCDNFIDLAHFPFLHASTFASEDAVTVGTAEISYDDHGFCAIYEHEFANREDPGVQSGLRPLIQRRKLTYQYHAPFTLFLTIDFLTSGGTNIIGFFVQPVNEEECVIFSTLWRDDLGGDPQAMKSAIEFERAIIEEDLWLQRQMPSLVLPLDPTIEVHTRADAMTLALRKVLRAHLGRFDQWNRHTALSSSHSAMSAQAQTRLRERDRSQPTREKAR